MVPRQQPRVCRLPSHVPAAKPGPVTQVAASSFLFSFLSWETSCSCCFPENVLTGSWKHHLIRQAVPWPARQRLWAPQPEAEGRCHCALSSRLRPGSEQGDGRNGDPLRKDAPGFPLPTCCRRSHSGLSPLKQVDALGQEFKFREKSVPSVHVLVHTRAHVRMCTHVYTGARTCPQSEHHGALVETGANK